MQSDEPFDVLRCALLGLAGNLAFAAVLMPFRALAQALLERLETRGVYVRQDSQREIIRETYAAGRQLVKALEATLSLDGLE